MMILDGEQKIAIAVMRKEDLINLHFSLGMAIRNAFGLYEQGNKLLASYADDASEEIIRELWAKLNSNK